MKEQGGFDFGDQSGNLPVRLIIKKGGADEAMDYDVRVIFAACHFCPLSFLW